MLRRTALLLTLTAVLAHPAGAVPRYRVVDLGFLAGGTFAIPYRLGAGRSVVGWCGGPSYPGGHATRWDLSATGEVLSRTDLQGLPGYTASAACALNGAGWAVGFTNTADPQPRAVLWRAGELLDLDRGGDGNANVYAFDVNESGVICGMITKSGGGGGWDAAIWQERAGAPGRFDRTLLPLHPSSDLFGWTEGLAILEDGRVFGRSNLGSNGDRASFWEADSAHTPVLLEPLANSIQSMPGDMNDLGDAVGYTMYTYGLQRATQWSRDASHTPGELPMWPGDNSASADVVDATGGLVFGRSLILDITPFPPVAVAQRVVMWVDGEVFQLADRLVPESFGWSLESVVDVNDDGWVAAVARQGGAQHAVVLIPEPEALAVSSAGPAEVRLARPWPNPARGPVHLGFTLARASDVRLTILDAQGRSVARLAEGRLAAGRQERIWSGKDDQGRAVGAGLYLASLETPAGRSSVRIVRVR